MNRSYFLPLTLASLAKVALNIIYFPLWWYGRGFISFVRSVGSFLRGQSQSIGLWVWIKNIFVPMYGQRDLAGRVISFFIRIVQIIARGVAIIFITLISLVMILAWLVLPVALLAAIFWQIYGTWQ